MSDKIIKVPATSDNSLAPRLNPTQGLGPTLIAEKMFLINFPEHNKKLCLSLHYNGANSYFFVIGTEHRVIKSQAKDSEIIATPLCLGNISKDLSEDNMKKTGFYGYVYDFSIMMLL